jgi:hypothetical protein
VRPPSWFRARGPPALRAALAEALGVATVERVAAAELPQDAADVPPPHDPTGPRLSAMAAPRGASRRGGAADKPELAQADAWFIQLAQEARPAGANTMLHDALPPAAKCVIALGGGRRSLPLPVPSRTVDVAAPLGAPVAAAAAAAVVCADEEAGRAPLQWEVPHPLAWHWLCGEPSSRGRLPAVDLTFLSALHGVSESAEAAAARPRDSGRRYAAAASLVLFEETGGIQARSLTLLPTRGCDAELLLLALSPRGGQPTRMRCRGPPAGAGELAIVALLFGAAACDAPPAELAPWWLTLADLRVLNALRRALSAAVLRGDAAALPAALAAFLALGDAVAARAARAPAQQPGALPSDAWVELVPDATSRDADAPWPPFALRRLEEWEAFGLPPRSDVCVPSA